MAKQPLWSTAVQLGTFAEISILIFLSFVFYCLCRFELKSTRCDLQFWVCLFKMLQVDIWRLIAVGAALCLGIGISWFRRSQPARQGRESTIGAATKLNQNHQAFESFNSGHLLEGRLVETTSGAETKSQLGILSDTLFKPNCQYSPSLAHNIHLNGMYSRL